MQENSVNALELRGRRKQSQAVSGKEEASEASPPRPSGESVDRQPLQGWRRGESPTARCPKPTRRNAGVATRWPLECTMGCTKTAAPRSFSDAHRSLVSPTARDYSTRLREVSLNQPLAGEIPAAAGRSVEGVSFDYRYESCCPVDRDRPRYCGDREDGEQSPSFARPVSHGHRGRG